MIFQFEAFKKHGRKPFRLARNHQYKFLSLNFSSKKPSPENFPLKRKARKL
jgi:hypothetical protein